MSNMGNKFIGNNLMYEFLKMIPHGKVVSYGFLGKLFCKHARSIAMILSANKNQDEFPCYKVVNSNGDIGGYNLGVDEKIKRLLADGVILIPGENVDIEKIKNYGIDSSLTNKGQLNNSSDGIKIDGRSFWMPKLTNFYVSFPLNYNSYVLFNRLIDSLKLKFGDSGINYQKVSSAHVTICFFGNILLDSYIEITNKSEGIDFDHFDIRFDDVGSFDDKVIFLKCGLEGTDILTAFYEKYLQGLSFDKEKNLYRPHITVCKIGKGYQGDIIDIKSYIKNFLKENEISVNSDFIRFSCAIDGVNQVPLVDIKLI